MEYLPGGDVFSLMQGLGAMDEDMARMCIFILFYLIFSPY
jgi:hypothetical protein